MKLLELFQDDLIKLPIDHLENGSKSFREYLFEKLDSYKAKIDSLDISDLNKFSEAAEKLQVENLINGIKTSINLYLEGYPSAAYSKLAQSFKMSMFSHLSNGNITPKQNLYRLRKEESAYSLSQQELFHIPFQERFKVRSQRYSIPGFPSLYLSNSVYVAWEEMRRPTPNQVQACRFVNLVPITYFDLTTDIYNENIANLEKLKAEDLWKHLIVWPLIASCSIKVADRSYSFFPEYIIPQLLLQIVRNEKKWDGLKFSSTHINLNKMRGTKGLFYNFVLPVKENKDSGYCNGLAEIFESTDVVPWQIVEFTKPIGAFIGAGDQTPYEVDGIELLAGMPLAYMYSIFGNLEERLCSMNTSKINTL